MIDIFAATDQERYVLEAALQQPPLRDFDYRIRMRQGGECVAWRSDGMRGGSGDTNSTYAIGGPTVTGGGGGGGDTSTMITLYHDHAREMACGSGCPAWAIARPPDGPVIYADMYEPSIGGSGGTIS